jgi:hypothetical protein
VADCASSARLSSDGFFGILWRFALKRYSSASFLGGTYFILHGYPIASTCSPASLETVSRMSDSFVERMAKSKAQEEDGSSENGQLDTGEFEKPEMLSSSVEDGDEKLPPFLGKQKSKLLQLRDSLLDLITGVSRDTLRSRAEDNEASAFGMHQADAGSDAYDRDFALSLLSQEQLIFLCCFHEIIKDELQQFIEFHVVVERGLLESLDESRWHSELHGNEFGGWHNATLLGRTQGSGFYGYKIATVEGLCFSHELCPSLLF